MNEVAKEEALIFIQAHEELDEGNIIVVGTESTFKQLDIDTESYKCIRIVGDQLMLAGVIMSADLSKLIVYGEN